MQENAIKQRVRMIEALWEEQLRLPGNKEAVLCCMMGQGTVDYRMIKGFLLVQMSDESGLPDVFMLTHHPFKEKNSYPQKIIGGIHQYIREWNSDPELATGMQVHWAPDPPDPGNEPVSNWFIRNLNLLAEALKIDTATETLTLALFPEPAQDPAAFADWIKETALHNSISEGIRFLVFDLYDSTLYETTERQLGKKFLRLYPDLDMPGAVSQLAEQMEANADSAEKRAIAAFQKNLLELNRAIGGSDEKAVIIYRAQCLEIAARHNWPAMEAIVHFFSHGFYTSGSDLEKATAEINAAVSKTQQLMKVEPETDGSTLVHYLITRGNMHYMHGNFKMAIYSYEQALTGALATGGTDVIVVNGISQMLGLSYYKNNDPLTAWDKFYEGWLLSIKDPSFEDSPLARFYAGEMRGTGMHKIPAYKELFDGLEKKWGWMWYEQLPKSPIDIQKEGLTRLQNAETVVTEQIK